MGGWHQNFHQNTAPIENPFREVSCIVIGLNISASATYEGGWTLIFWYITVPTWWIASCGIKHLKQKLSFGDGKRGNSAAGRRSFCGVARFWTFTAAKFFVSVHEAGRIFRIIASLTVMLILAQKPNSLQNIASKYLSFPCERVEGRVLCITKWW